MTVSEYLNTTMLNYGGELCSMGKIISELQKQGIPERCIGLYIMGLQANMNREKRARMILGDGRNDNV